MDPSKHTTAAPSLPETKTTGRPPSVAQRTGAGILDFPIAIDVVSEKKEKRHRRLPLASVFANDVISNGLLPP